MSRSQTLRNSSSKSCCRCGESWPDAMTRCGLCYECVLIREGRKRAELHHPFGRESPIVARIIVEIPGNWHRALDARRQLRPDILKRPGNNGLQQIAAIVTTFGEAADTLAAFARHRQWPEWIAELADLFVRVADSVVERLLILAGELERYAETPEWFP
jgi:hypothetical protein